jgi:copper resistance protein B
MKAFLVAGLASLALTSPVAAQHSGHSSHGVGTPETANPTPIQPEVRLPAKRASKNRKAAPRELATTPEPAAADAHPQAGHDVQHVPASPDPHEGHNMSQMAAQPDPHAGHDMSAMPMGSQAKVGTDLSPGNALAPVPQPGLAATRYWGADTMAEADRNLRREHGGMTYHQVMFNIAEYQAREGADGYRWDGEFWLGGDINRFTLKSEGEGTFGALLERAEIQTLYSRALDPYWNLQVGIRHDIKPNPSRTYATIGIEGLAPYWFEVEGALFLSDKGDVFARAEAYYDQRITQDFVLQPRVEANFSAQDVLQNGVGPGLTDLEVGLRLRYERTREFAPYIGVSWERQFGGTARFSRAKGEGTGGFSFAAGVRTWF